MKWVIREFRTKRIVEAAASYAAGFNRCIDLYVQSGRVNSFFVQEAS